MKKKWNEASLELCTAGCAGLIAVAEIVGAFTAKDPIVSAVAAIVSGGVAVGALVAARAQMKKARPSSPAVSPR